MKLLKKKKDLLNTQMNQLGLGKAFNGYFFNYYKSSTMSQSDVLTLAEFITLNPKLITNNDMFVCWKTEDIKRQVHQGLVKDSRSFIKLRNFLLENGFNQNDWILLLPTKKTGRGEVPDFKYLEKSIIRQMPVYKLTEVKPTCDPFRKICSFVFGDTWTGNAEQLTVGDILKLSPKAIKHQSLIGGWDCFDRTTMRTFLGIQKKFSEHGLNEKDGPFMKAFLEPLNSVQSYVADLVQNEGFSKKEAETAVRVGKKVGWI